MLGTTEISSTQDCIDSRDIVERIKYLEIDEPTEFDPYDADDWAELKTLRALCEEMRGYGGDTPEDGITLVRDSYFEEHAQDFAADTGAIDNTATWPLYCIDWERAARDWQMDYTSLEFDGVTYWYR